MSGRPLGGLAGRALGRLEGELRQKQTLGPGCGGARGGRINALTPPSGSRFYPRGGAPKGRSSIVLSLKSLQFRFGG